MDLFSSDGVFSGAARLQVWLDQRSIDMRSKSTIAEDKGHALLFFASNRS